MRPPGKDGIVAPQAFCTSAHPPAIPPDACAWGAGGRDHVGRPVWPDPPPKAEWSVSPAHGMGEGTEAPYMHPMCPWVDVGGDGFYRGGLPASFPPTKLVQALIRDSGPVCVICEPVAMESDLARELEDEASFIMASSADSAVAAEAIALGVAAHGRAHDARLGARPCQRCKRAHGRRAGRRFCRPPPMA